MKIYNEVTIDMNPESSTYGKHLSEESCEYTGDIASCGSSPKDINIRTSKGRGRPGLSLLGLPRFGHKLPETVFGGEQSNIFMPGVVTDVGGAQIPNYPTHGAVKPGLYDKAETRGIGGVNKYTVSSAGYGREDPITGTTGGGQFADWYGDPGDKGQGTGYLEAAVGRPLRDVREKGFISVDDLGLNPDIVSDYQGTKSFGGRGGASGIPLPKGILGDIEAEKYTLGQAHTTEAKAQDDFDKEMLRLKDQRTDLLATEEINRQKALRGELSQSDIRQAMIAKTGMAASGPAERAVEEQIAMGAGALGDIARKKRGIQTDYEGAVDVAETTQADAEKALSDAKRQYGLNIGGVLQDAKANALQQLTDVTGLIKTGHQAAGQEFDVSQVHPSGAAWSASANVPEYGALQGMPGYGAPAGGWFNEPGTNWAPYKGAQQDIIAADEFSNFISGLSAGDLSALGANIGADADDLG